MNRLELKQQIGALTQKITDIKAQAQRQGRRLNKAEQDLVVNLLGAVDDLRAELDSLPAHPPLTVQGFGTPGRGSAAGPFNSLGDQLSAVMTAGMPNGRADDRLFHVTAAATGLSESVQSDGGFLLQSDFSTELLTRTIGQSQVASRCERIQIGPNANSITLPAVDETSRATGSRWGGIQSYWVDEAAEITKSKPKFRKLELNLHKLCGLCYATDELVQDSTVLEQVIRQGFADEFSFVLDDMVINGSGSGQPLGILNAGCLVSVAKESGQAADSVVWENIIKMTARLPGRSRRNAAWFINANVYPQLLQMSLAVGTGGVPVWTPPAGESPYDRLLGLPVIPIEQCPTLGDQGDIILADFSEYLLAEKGGMQGAMSVHIRFVYDESVFRFVLRVDGQPILASSITPYKGSDAISPFITLDARA